MAGLKEIRRRIASVMSTKQITRAMKLVSAAKLRRAQESAVFGRAYVRQLAKTLARVKRELPENFTHPLLGRGAAEHVAKRRVVVVAGERGLCGAYNANLIKAAAASESDASIQRDFVCIGRRAVSAAKRYNWNVVTSFEGIPEAIAHIPIDDIIQVLIRDFRSGDVDEVVVYFTEFASAMSQKVKRLVLLPFSDEQSAEGVDIADEEFEGAIGFDPSPETIFSELIPLAVRSQLLQCLLESRASEHAARMTAMDSATTNANELIDKLRLHYNRARQSAITTELIDIVGGAGTQS